MAERRSLSNAMEITPEKLEFIQGAKIQGKAHAEEPSTPSLKPGAQAPNGQDSVPRSRRPRSPLRGRQKAEPIPEGEALSMLNGFLVPLTTRLQPETADALRRAYLEQKLARKTPATQQEIVEAALQDWLKGHAYL